MKTIDEISDYKEAAEVLDSEYAALGWHGTKVHGGFLSCLGGWEHYDFQVEFAPPCKPHAFFEWKQGIGVRSAPNPAEVLGRCCADYLSAAGVSFEDWAEEFGYDSDSRKAFRIYEECLAIGKKLKALNLSRDQISRFADLANML